MRTSMRRRAGFTLVELVVVIMIIGILAAIAAPKIINASSSANDNAARANLRVIRDALDTYAANYGTFPPASGLSAMNGPLAPYLRNGIFPNCPVGAHKGTNGVATATGTTQGQAPTPDGSTNAYIYDQSQGWIIINDTTQSAGGTGPAYSTF